MKNKTFYCILQICLLATSCDAVSNYEGNEVAATKKMHRKIRKTQAALKEHTNVILYKEAQRITDSIKLTLR